MREREKEEERRRNGGRQIQCVVASNYFCVCVYLRAGCIDKSYSEGGILQSLERFHSILCQTRAPHCADFHLLGEVESAVLQPLCLSSPPPS